jgi:hypothetical protein
LLNKLVEYFKGKRKVAALILLVSLGLMLVAISSVGADNTAEGQGLAEYKRELEKSLEKLCSEVEGVGKCTVMVSFSRGEQSSYKGNHLIESKPPRVQGVTVVCQGGKSVAVRAHLSEMLSALFDIGANCVAVLPSKN